jgi:hypothetical protein
MRTTFAILIVGMALTSAVQAACEGPRCPPIMPRLRDGSDLDKQLAACNANAIWNLMPTWREEFRASCGKLHKAFLETDAGAKEKAKAIEHDKQLDALKSLESATAVELTDDQKAKLTAPAPAPALASRSQTLAVRASPPPAAVASIEIGPADADEFREIVNTVGAKDQPLLIRWFTKLLARAQAVAIAAEAAKAKDPAE